MWQVKNTKGFTLIELMVVVVVLTILTMVAYPAYIDQVTKARRTDGRVALLAIAQAQERHFTVNGAYTATLTELSIDSVLQSGESESGYYDLAVVLEDSAGADCTTCYIATATPDSATAQGDDSDCTTMTITHIGVKDGTPADDNKCW